MGFVKQQQGRAVIGELQFDVFIWLARFVILYDESKNGLAKADGLIESQHATAEPNSAARDGMPPNRKRLGWLMPFCQSAHLQSYIRALCYEYDFDENEETPNGNVSRA